MKATECHAETEKNPGPDSEAGTDMDLCRQKRNAGRNARRLQTKYRLKYGSPRKLQRDLGVDFGGRAHFAGAP